MLPKLQISVHQGISSPRTFLFRRKQVYMIEDLMERGPLLKEEYDVEPIPENLAIPKFIQVRAGWLK